MRKPLFLSTLLLASAFPLQATSFWDLDFSRYAFNASGSTQGGNRYNDPNLGTRFDVATIYFTNVAPGNPEGASVNLIVRATPLNLQSQNGGAYTWTGFYPNYKDINGNLEPNGDLGTLYNYTGGQNGNNFDAHSVSLGGTRLEFTFYDGSVGNGFTELYEVPTFRILAYDVDGDADGNNNNAGQQERITAYIDDGFYAYQRSVRADQLPLGVSYQGTEESPSSFTFSGIRENIPEDDARATVLLWYQNTSSFTLDLTAITNGSSSGNPTFTAIDGDLSLFGGNRNEDEQPPGFEERVYVIPVPVPEPSTYALIGLAGLGGLLLHRKRSQQ